MKKAATILLILISFFSFIRFGEASYIIHLKHGGQFVTPQYWEDKGGMIFFFVKGGTIGIEKNTVKNIKKLNISDEGEPADKEKETPAGAGPLPDQKIRKEEKVDLKAYENKMAKLKTALNKTLDRIKKADADNNQLEKDAAIEENRKISAEMWELTDELKEKNNGKLPVNWWEGVGR